MITFDFSKGKISRLKEKLSKLNPKNPNQYPDYKKYMTELINLDDNNLIYLDKIQNNVGLFTTHAAKLYFHWRTTEAEGLRNPDKNRKHWLEEIVSLFRFTSFYDFNNTNKEIRLNINKLDHNYKIQLKHILMPNDMVLNKLPDMVDKLTKGDADDKHKLPPISITDLTLKWPEFLKSYEVFLDKIIERITYSSNGLKIPKMMEFMDRVYDNNYLTMSAMYKGTDDIKFSELAVEDMIEMFRNY